jgi:hypothetical protein
MAASSKSCLILSLQTLIRQIKYKLSGCLSLLEFGRSLWYVNQNVTSFSAIAYG